MDNLSKFEREGGLVTSTRETGCQWDAPFGWAPYHYIAIKGMTNYGYYVEAKRLSFKFAGLVLKLFNKNGIIVEKYDVCNLSDQVDNIIKYGYVDNEIGFGWTNGVFLSLLTVINS